MLWVVGLAERGGWSFLLWLLLWTVGYATLPVVCVVGGRSLEWGLARGCRVSRLFIPVSMETLCKLRFPFSADILRLLAVLGGQGGRPEEHPKTVTPCSNSQSIPLESP